MKLKENYTQPIAANLKNAAEAYKLASNKISSNLLSKYLEQLAKEKELLFNKICGDESVVQTKKNVLDTEQIKGRFRKSDRQVEIFLILCLDHEEELIKAYQKALTLEAIGDQNRYQLEKQLNNSLASYNQLKMMKVSRHYNLDVS
jgi:hypothetical protein